jgi:hypothetical protein
MLAQRYQKKMLKITDADEACRSSEISVDLIIIIVFWGKKYRISNFEILFGAKLEVSFDY